MNQSYPDFLNILENLNENQRLALSSVRGFVKKEASPLIKEAYRKEEFPLSLIKPLGEMGILGASLKGYGLPGMDSISYGLAMKELARCDSSLRSFASVQGSLVMYPILTFGSEEQKGQWLPLLAKGEAVGCFGLTESEGGSDPSMMKTRAFDRGDHWELSGSKMWITNGNLADIAVVWAQTDKGIRGFLVPTNSEGFKAIKIKNKLSMRASNTSELYFDKVKLKKEALLPKTEGLKSALTCLNQARYSIVWGVLGAAESCFDEACRFVQDRSLFGAPLAEKQLIQRKLAIMLGNITQGQLLAQRLGELKDSGKIHFTQVSLGKQSNSKMALDVARTCRDILGGSGITDEYSVMRNMCNLETIYTYEGTNDIHQLILGQQITGLSAF